MSINNKNDESLHNPAYLRLTYWYRKRASAIMSIAVFAYQNYGNVARQLRLCFG